MISRIWKGIWEDKPKCGSEMKVGVQVHKGLTCKLPAGHPGRHQTNMLTTWANKTEDHRPGGPEDL